MDTERKTKYRKEEEEATFANTGKKGWDLGGGPLDQSPGKETSTEINEVRKKIQKDRSKIHDPGYNVNLTERETQDGITLDEVNDRLPDITPYDENKDE